MIKVNIYNFTGDVIDNLDLSEKLFNESRNDSLVQQVYLVQASNSRLGLSHKKDRGDVSGGGKKPWKQKGTGRARVGSSRNPLWKGGGVVFGPTKFISFAKKINIKMKRKAIAIVLSSKLKNGKFYVVDSFNLGEKKTKIFVNLINKLGLNNKNVLLSFSDKEKGKYKLADNISKVSTIDTNRLNVFDLVNSEYLVLSKDSLESLVNKYVS